MMDTDKAYNKGTFMHHESIKAWPTLQNPVHMRGKVNVSSQQAFKEPGGEHKPAMNQLC